MDAKGAENGKGGFIRGLEQDECFDKCRANTHFKGCAYYPAENRCDTYKGDVVNGNGHGAYKCFHSPPGKKYILLTLF